MTATLEREHVGGFQRIDRPLFALPPEGVRQASVMPPENELASFCEELFRRSKNYRDGRLRMLDRWRSHLAWYLNNGTSPHSGELSTTYVNMIFELVESASAEFAESPPKFNYRPTEPKGIPLAKLLNDAVPFIWQKQDADEAWLDTTTAIAIYGTWYWKIAHDPRYKTLGHVERIRQVPCWNMFPAPYSTSFRDCPYVIEVRPRTVGQIYRDYGVKVEPEIMVRDLNPEVGRELGVMRGGSHPDVVPPDPSNPSIADSKSVPTIPETFLGKGEESNIVLQKELHIRDASLEGQWIWDTTEFVPRLAKSATLKYPRGRTISWANGRVLYDLHNVYNDGEFPYVLFRDNVVPDFWYGLGEVHHVVDLQLLHDDTIEMMKLMHLFTTMGKLIIGKGTGIAEGSIQNLPGEILWPNDGTEDRIKWLFGATPPAELYQHTGQIQMWADLVSGRHGVDRGINPPGVRSGKMLEGLAAQAGTRTKKKVRYLETSLRRGGRLLGSRVRQFWPSFREMPTDVQGQQQFKGRTITPDQREADVDVNVDVVANMEILRAREFQKVLMIASMGGASMERVIDAADLTEGEEMKLELQEVQARQAAAISGDTQKESGSRLARSSATQRAIGRGATPAK